MYFWELEEQSVTQHGFTFDARDICVKLVNDQSQSVSCIKRDYIAILLLFYRGANTFWRWLIVGNDIYIT